MTNRVKHVEFYNCKKCANTVDGTTTHDNGLFGHSQQRIINV